VGTELPVLELFPKSACDCSYCFAIVFSIVVRQICVLMGGELIDIGIVMFYCELFLNFVPV
jgi:hypothetical protein